MVPIAARSAARSAALMVVLAGALACAAATPARAPAQQPVAGEAPLAGFASQKLAVMPVQFLRVDSTAPVKPADWAKLRLELDDSIGAALAARGVGKKWAYAADIARLAKRNSDYVSDPYTLGAIGFRDPKKKVGDPAPMAVLNNMRSLIALGDSRFALIPVDFGFTTIGKELRPKISFVLVDGRAGQMLWFADVVGAALTKFTSAELGVFAERIADLVGAR